MATYVVQSIRIPRDHHRLNGTGARGARTIAREYAKGDAGRVGKVDTTAGFYRFRLRSPALMRPGSYRTYTSPSGVEVVSAIPKARRNPRGDTARKSAITRHNSDAAWAEVRDKDYAKALHHHEQALAIASMDPVYPVKQRYHARKVAELRARLEPRKNPVRGVPWHRFALTMKPDARHPERLPVRVAVESQHGGTWKEMRGSAMKLEYDAIADEMRGVGASWSAEERRDMLDAARKAYRELYPHGHPNAQR